MTNSEAIGVFKERIALAEKYGYTDEIRDYIEAMNLAIDALEKQEPMKPLQQEMDIDGRAITPCGSCGEELTQNILYDFCPHCGQRILHEKGH